MADSAEPGAPAVSPNAPTAGAEFQQNGDASPTAELDELTKDAEPRGAAEPQKEDEAVKERGDEKKQENGTKDEEPSREKRRERSRSRSRRTHRERSRSDSRRRRERSRERRSGRDRRRSRSDSRRRRRERSKDRRRDRRSRSRSKGRYRRDNSPRRRSPRRSPPRRRSPSRSRSRDTLPYVRPAPLTATTSLATGFTPGLTVPTLPGTGLAGAGLAGGLGGLSTLPGGLNPLLTNPYLLPNLSGGTQAAGLSQATRPSRRLYVGSLPTPCYDYQLQTFLNQALVALGLCRSTGKMPIIQCTVTPERGFAFIEFADIMDATCGLALDGIPYMGVALKIKRPKDYNPPYGAPPDPQPLGAAALAALLAQQQTNAMAGAAVATATGLPPGSMAATSAAATTATGTAASALPPIPAIAGNAAGSVGPTGPSLPSAAGGGAGWP